MFDGPMHSRFQWFDCNDPAFDSLVAEAMGSHGQITARGYSQNDIDIRFAAYSYLLAAMAASGPDGLPVEIAKGNDKKTTSRYPKGWQIALEKLLADGWILSPVLPNPTGSWELYDARLGTVNRPKNGRDYVGQFKGSGGCYCLSPKAWEKLTALHFDKANLMPSRLHGVVVKDARKIHLSPLPEHPQLDQWLDQLADYNERLKTFTFEVNGKQIGVTEFSLHRVFNHSGYDRGGRFYSRFNNWASDDRRQLRIDGKPVLSVDFKNLHGRLSLAIVGEACPEGDLYELDGFDREQVKAAWSAALNSNNRTGITGRSNSKVIIQAILGRYPKLKTVFGCRVGLHLQRADSELVGIVLDAFVKAARPILPLHDGFYFLPEDRDLLLQVIDLGVLSLFKVVRLGYPDTQDIDLPMDWLK
jgi:hypothetical protein